MFPLSPDRIILREIPPVLIFNSFEYKDVATKLSITPHINQSDVLRLEIDTEVTRIKTARNTPTTFKRTATTTVILNDRNTVVIGGIIGHDARDDDTKVPILGDIPLLDGCLKPILLPIIKPICLFLSLLILSVILRKCRRFS